jgi:hypothetical protein
LAENHSGSIPSRLGVSYVSIGSIGNLAFAYSSTPRPIDTPIDRRSSSTAELSAWSYLTSGDRDLITAIYGSDALAQGFDQRGKPVELPKFAAVLIDDRKSGRLAAGVEVSSTYLQSIWDRYENPAGAALGDNPLTAQNLTDGLDFLSRQTQGGAVDLRA